ncbi:hypothetical protein V6N13_025085 [Hibiscus sabdariffa]|uniref:C2H2-type domain-containing protein n=1 Tax=Hibiscus sabdariffa TaxID=183260 RepID=A0ABR2NMH2_9ROSI
MAQPGELGSDGKSAPGNGSSEPRTEYICPTCSKTFYSTNALCAHQNAHRLVKEPMKMSPVLAAVLNNPPPPFHKPFLLPSRPKLPIRPPAREPTANQPPAREPPANQPPTPRYHPYRRAGEESNPNQLQEDDDFLGLSLGNKPRYSQPSKTAVPEYKKDSQSLTKDLLGEWVPITGFGEYGKLGTSSGQVLSHAVTTDAKPEPEIDLELRLRTSTTTTKSVDLELKLGR